MECLFLRIYAKNLSRSYRSEPANACADTEIAVTTLIILLVSGLFLIAGSALFPHYLRLFVNGGGSSVAVIAVLVVGIAYSVHVRFGRFEHTPELAQMYRLARSRLWAQVLFWFFPYHSIFIYIH